MSLDNKGTESGRLFGKPTEEPQSREEAATGELPWKALLEWEPLGSP